MGEIQKIEPVKLIFGLLASEEKYLEPAQKEIENLWGDIDFKSPVLPFEYTEYYQDEMGRGIKRQFVSSKKLISPEEIAGIKIQTNEIEKKFLDDGKNRRINIDPGYLETSKLVLATTKNFYQRTYLNKGIYAEVTLTYKDKQFQHWPWTYPDYRTEEYKKIFTSIRDIYIKQLKTSPSPLINP